MHICAITWICYKLLIPNVIILQTQRPTVGDFTFQETSIAWINDFHFLHHLTYNYFNVLVVDSYTL